MISSAGILVTVRGGFSERWVRLFGEASVVGLAHLAWRGAFLLLFLIFARGLGENAIATVGFINVTIVTLAGAVGMGAGPFTVRLFARAGMIDEKSWREDASALIMLLLVATIIATIAFFFMLPADQWVGAWLAPIAGLAVIGTATNAALNGLRAYGIMLLNSSLAALVMLGFAVASMTTGSLLLGLVALAAGFAVKTIADLIFLRRNMTRAKWELDGKAIRRTLVAAFWMGGAGAVTSLGLWWLAKILLERLGEGDFARYLIGMQWYALGAFAVGQLTRVVMPLQVRAAVEGRRLRRLAVLLLLGTLASLGFGTVCYFARDLISSLYGDGLADMGAVIWPFALASASVASANMLGNQLVAEGRERWWLVVSIGWAAMLFMGMWQMGVPSLLAFLLALVLANLTMMLLAILFVFVMRREPKAMPAYG